MSGKVDNFSTNVLIIGKSGVGKSSLLNYIFDQQLAETGSGKPVTKEEIYKYSMEHPSGMTVYVFDTWGLEADKADRWTKLIMDEVTAHDCADICDWFHTILYCISARSARIEDFERQQIKLLLDSGNRVIVCLTHCDARNVEQSISALTAELCAIGLTEKDIIQTVSVSKKLLGSSEAAPRRGREEIFLKIQSNLLETVAAKLPAQLTAYSNKLIDDWFSFSCKGVKANLNKSNANSADFKNFVMETAVKQLRQVIGSIESEYRKRASEAMDYYKKLCSAISVEIEDFVSDFNIDISIDKFLGYEDELEEALDSFIHTIPVFGSILNYIEVRNACFEFEIMFRKYADQTKGEMGRYFYSLSDKLKKRSPDIENDERETKIINEDIFVNDAIEFSDCRLDFQAKIYLEQETKIVLKNCDITVDPSIPAAIYGNNAEITLINCRLTYHGSNDSESYFIYGDDLDITFIDTELCGCYCMYSKQYMFKRLSYCNDTFYSGPNYNVPTEFSHYHSERGTSLQFLHCCGRIDYTLTVHDDCSETVIIIKDSKFSHSGTKYVESDRFIFEGKSAELENSIFENFSVDEILYVTNLSVNNCLFRNCTKAFWVDNHGTARIEHSTFDNCNGVLFISGDETTEITECEFINCCGTVVCGGNLLIEKCNLDGGLPQIRTSKTQIKDCKFLNWSMRYAFPRMKECLDHALPLNFSDSLVIDNCIFENISLTDAGNVSIKDWTPPKYLIDAGDEIFIRNTQFESISVKSGIVRTTREIKKYTKPLLPFMPYKETVEYHYTDLTVENCTGIDSDGNAI